MSSIEADESTGSSELSSLMSTISSTTSSASSIAMIPCAKCGRTGHVATNRNCPRGATSVLQAPPPPAIPPTRKKRNVKKLCNYDTKFIKEAKLGESTKFWYYSGSESPGGEKEEDDDDDSNGSGDDGDDDDEELEIVEERNLEQSSKEFGGINWVGLDETKGPMRYIKLSLAPEKQNGRGPANLSRTRTTALRTTITTKTPKRAAPDTSPQSPQSPATKRAKETPSCTNEYQLLAKDKLTEADKQVLQKDALPKPRPKLSELEITEEYLEWCDRPENDPYHPDNLAKRTFNYMGNRNILKPGRVQYGRNLQGWRECRSVGKGLGHSDSE